MTKSVVEIIDLVRAAVEVWSRRRSRRVASKAWLIRGNAPDFPEILKH